MIVGAFIVVVILVAVQVVQADRLSTIEWRLRRLEREPFHPESRKEA